MKPEFKELRKNIVDLIRDLSTNQQQLEELTKRCSHKYTPVAYDPIITEAYTIPGDAPGTMGVDWRGPVYVPRTEQPRWKRECTECGLVEYTTDVAEKIERVPAWPRGGRR